MLGRRTGRNARAPHHHAFLFVDHMQPPRLSITTPEADGK